MESEGRKIHTQAAHAREEGRHLDSLKLHDEAILAYSNDKDTLGLAEVLADRSIVYRHLFDETENKDYLILAKYELLAAIEMAERSGIRQALAIPYAQLGNVQKELRQLEDAKVSYKKAIEYQTNNPAPQHNRPGVLADMKARLAILEYVLGDKLALKRALDVLRELEQSDEPKYNRDVWLSGGYMKIAEMLKEDDPEKAEVHLQKAKEIIDDNPDLKLRKVQWEKLAATFN